ncbi:MAG: kelch repeat-containing protein, partial [Planctomycetota bacterium]|nr:kelch repeat-containing protein [Planctomycetota bacterium]
MKQSRHSVPTVFAALGQTSLAAARSLALPAARTAALPLLLPLALLIALPAALPSVLHAQQTGFTWTQVASTVPQSRYAHAMAYDSGRSRTVLFGGTIIGGSSVLGDTWEWNGATAAYTLVASTGPQSRYSHAMAYDSGRNRTVLFGGYNGGSSLGDTWEWNGATAAWTLVASTGPSSRYGHAMAYDSGRNRTVLFGGVGNIGRLGDSWEWNGATRAWTQVASFGPQSRSSHAMAYDSGRSRTVLFGGLNGVGIPLGDTWEWNGANAAWTLVASNVPQSRYAHAMAYDSGRNRTVLFGGT